VRRSKSHGGFSSPPLCGISSHNALCDEDYLCHLVCRGFSRQYLSNMEYFTRNFDQDHHRSGSRYIFRRLRLQADVILAREDVQKQDKLAARVTLASRHGSRKKASRALAKMITVAAHDTTL
jgi:hypothetical protein